MRQRHTVESAGIAVGKRWLPGGHTDHLLDRNDPSVCGPCDEPFGPDDGTGNL